MPKKNAPTDGAGSGPNVFLTYRWLTRHGCKPVALRYRSKGAHAQGYEKDGYVPPPIEFWYKGKFGIGVKTGPREQGPVDGDMDCNEAIYFGPLFFPDNPSMWGRETKPCSHLPYLIDDAEFAGAKFLDPISKSMILELRGDGGNQTVCPGSLHEDTGEEVRFSREDFGPDGPDIPRAILEDLIKAAKWTAIATLICRYMWNEGSRNFSNSYLAGIFWYLEWPIDDAVRMIEAVMAYMGDDDKTRKLTVLNTYKKGDRGAKVAGAGKLRELLGPALDPAVNKLLEWAGAPDYSFMAEYNERFGVVSVEGKFRIADTSRENKTPTFFQREDFLAFFGTDKFTIQTEDGKEKKVSKAAVWLNSPSRRTYEDVDFVPGQDETPRVLNLWPGWAVEPKKGKCKAWLRLLKEVICGHNEAKFQWLLNWFANILRDPLHKPLTAPVFIGPQGAGKSLSISYFGRILGLGYLPVTDPEHIHGRFNNHLAHTLLLHSEEALYAGDKRHAAIIKSLITDDYRMFEPKNVNAKRVNNYLRLVLTSNYERAAPVEAGDRRYTIFNLGKRRASKELIAEVLKEMSDGGPAALMHYLLHEHDYDAETPRLNIKDEEFFAVRVLNYSVIEGWWHDRLAMAEVLPDVFSWAQRPKGDEEPWPNVVSSDALWRSFCMHAQSLGQRQPLEPMAFALEFDKLVGRKLDRNKRVSFINPWLGDSAADRLVRDATERPRTISNMPTVLECRKAFEDHVGHAIEWPELEQGEPVKVQPNARWNPRVIANEKKAAKDDDDKK